MWAIDPSAVHRRLRVLWPLLAGTAVTGAAAQGSALERRAATVLDPAAIPRALPSTPVDVGALAAQLQAAQAAGANSATGHRLYVFVSLTMPAASLTRLIRQAAQAGATLVLRGLQDGSMQQTVQAWASLQSDAGASAHLQIDPEAFDRYAISAVPTFVLAVTASPPVACTGGRCATGHEFVKSSGDVSMGYALRRMALLPSAPVQVLRQLRQRVPE